MSNNENEIIPRKIDNESMDSYRFILRSIVKSVPRSMPQKERARLILGVLNRLEFTQFSIYQFSGKAIEGGYREEQALLDFHFPSYTKYAINYSNLEYPTLSSERDCQLMAGKLISTLVCERRAAAYDFEEKDGEKGQPKAESLKISDSYMKDGIESAIRPDDEEINWKFVAIGAGAALAVSILFNLHMLATVLSKGL